MSRIADPIACNTTFTCADTFPLRACDGKQLLLYVELCTNEVVTIKGAWLGSSFTSVVRGATKKRGGDVFEDAAEALKAGEFPSATIRPGDHVYGIGDWSVFPVVWFQQDCSVATAVVQMPDSRDRLPVRSIYVAEVEDAWYVYKPRMPVWPTDPMERLEWLGRYMSWKLAYDRYSPQQCADHYVAHAFAEYAAYHRIRCAPLDEEHARKITDEVAQKVAEHYGFSLRTFPKKTPV